MFIHHLKIGLQVTCLSHRQQPTSRVCWVRCVTSAGALVQWLKLLAWKFVDRWFRAPLRPQVSKKQNVSSPLTRKHPILWGTSVTKRERARPQTPELEFRILWLEGRAMSLISPSSVGFPEQWVSNQGRMLEW